MTVNITFKQHTIKRIKEACDRGSCYECPFNRDPYTRESGCVKRIEKYIGKYDLKYNELFNIFYVEGVPNE